MAPVAGFIRVPNVMEVNPNVPAKTVAEFIAYAKANPGKINMASSGVGTSVHLSGALFMMMTGVNLVHVPYRGAAPALTDMLGRPGAGDVRQSAVVDRAHPGRQAARARGDDGDARRGAARTCRPSAETVPGYEASAFFGMAVPKGTPRAIIDKLNRDHQRRRSPIRRCRPGSPNSAAPTLRGTPEDFGKIIADETEKWAKVVKATGATAE